MGQFLVADVGHFHFAANSTLSVSSYRHKFRSERDVEHHPIMFSDYHTTQNSINMDGRRRKDIIVSRRGYLADGLDVAAIIPKHDDAERWLEQLVYAIQQPYYTPYLGRRSNPLAAPLAEPNEKVVSVQSTEELCELLYRRLSHLQTGFWSPSNAILRIPQKLQEKTNSFLEKWTFAGQDISVDHRPGLIRFFKNRVVCVYSRKSEIK